MKPQKFRAKIFKIGINPCVDLPKRVSAVFTKRGPISVTGSLNDFAIRATLVPLGNGRHRLYINGEMRKEARVDTGDRVQLALKLDRKPRIVPVPEEFTGALAEHPKARAVYKQLPPSKRKEFLVYLNWIKRPETLKRNVGKIIAKLLGNGSERSGMHTKVGRPEHLPKKSQ